MRTEEEIREHIQKLKEKLTYKIARACVGYKENVSATIKDLRGQIKSLEWVLESEATND